MRNEELERRREEKKTDVPELVGVFKEEAEGCRGGGRDEYGGEERARINAKPQLREEPGAAICISRQPWH